MRLVDADTREQLKKVRTLYEAAFPKSEKKPFGMILRGRKKGNYELLAVEDEDGTFQGLAITMLYGELVLLDYFAIEPGCRGTGVGSGALKALQRRYRGKKFLLEIESTVGLDGAAGDREGNVQSDGTDLRLRRKEFYLRNGMQPMDFLVNLFGVEMELMTYECSVTFEEYHAIFEHVLPFGMAARVKPAGYKGNMQRIMIMAAALVCIVAAVCFLTGPKEESGQIIDTGEESASQELQGETNEVSEEGEPSDSGLPGDGQAAEAETIDIDAFVELPLQEYAVDLTGDGMPDKIEIYLLGEGDDDISQAEELVSRHARRISVKVTDGKDAESTLYSKIFSDTHVENGQLLLVQQNGRSYLMECSILEQQGGAGYEYSVFDFENQVQNLADSDKVSFATDKDMVERMKRWGEEVVLRGDVVPDFRANIEKWFDDAVLLVACDITNYFYSQKEVYVSDTDTVYRPEDYFDGVWERADELE